MSDLTLYGFGPSVYTRAARICLIETGQDAHHVEVDPFADPPDPTLARVTPLGRVPVLVHEDFTLTETAAILRYLDALAGAGLVPRDARAAARMAQVMGLVDAYGYWPMVRDVFSHGFYRPHVGEPADPDRVVQGARQAAPLLQTLEAIAAEGRVISASRFSLADIHLGVMVDYFVRVPAGASALSRHPALLAWWTALRDRPAFSATDPFA